MEHFSTAPNTVLSLSPGNGWCLSVSGLGCKPVKTALLRLEYRYGTVARKSLAREGVFARAVAESTSERRVVAGPLVYIRRQGWMVK